MPGPHEEFTKRIMNASIDELSDTKFVENGVLGGMSNDEMSRFTVQLLQVRQILENMKTSASARRFTFFITICTVVIALTGVANVLLAVYF